MNQDAKYWVEAFALWEMVRSAFVFAWGAGDPAWLLALKRIFLLLPLGAVVLGYWTNLLSLPTIVVRSKRRAFISRLLVTCGTWRGQSSRFGVELSFLRLVVRSWHSAGTRRGGCRRGNASRFRCA
jgi:hypothetical protein